MTIRILTRHPALRYVLGRSAPLGATVRSPDLPRKSSREAVYAIDIDSRPAVRGDLTAVLCSWIPAYIRQYGAQRVEIDGRPVGVDEAQLRRALSGRRGSPSPA